MHVIPGIPWLISGNVIYRKPTFFYCYKYGFNTRTHTEFLEKAGDTFRRTGPVESTVLM